MKKTLCLLLAVVFVLVLFAACGPTEKASDAEEPATEQAEPAAEDTASAEVDEGIEPVDIRFGLSPYVDHSDASIAIENGWFEEVGINIDWTDVSLDDCYALFAADTVDVLSAPQTCLLPILDRLQTESFVQNDAFYGFAIMADAADGYKTFQDFIDEGKTPNDAVKEVVAQMKGKRFAYSSEVGPRGFINIAFEKAGMSLDEVTSLVQEDANSISLMMSDQADFATGGAPLWVTLQKNGYVCLLNTVDIAATAEASADSVEQRSLCHGSWNVTSDFAADEANYVTLLRMASVKFRINQYINEHPEEAADIHINFLNKIAGTEQTVEDCLAYYEDLDPFYTFEQQGETFFNPEDVLCVDYCSGALIKSYEEEGVLTGEWTADDFHGLAKRVYEDMKTYKADAESMLADLANAEGEAAEYRDLAQKHYDIFNFYDAARLAEIAVGLM